MSFDREVLITGGCGSIGAGVVAYFLEEDTEQKITVYDSDEQGIFGFRRNVGAAYPELEFVLGDVRDEQRLQSVMEGVDHVVHTAGLKQVPECESNPYEAIRTNVDGTWNVIRAANRAGVSSVLTLSTDKAVTPTSTMGASKLLAERLTRSAARRFDGTRFGCVRLGNVVGSAGSVVPLFRNQIENGGPVTVTDREMTRFVMSKHRAAEFVVDCVRSQAAGDVTVPKIDRLRLVDLVETMVDEYAPPETSPERIGIETIGRRPGERLHEFLIGPTEVSRAVEHEDRYTIRPPGETAGLAAESADLPSGGYRSDTKPFLDRDGILDLIEGGTATTTDSASGREALVAASAYDS